MDFQTSLVGATSVRVNVTGGSNTDALTIGRAAIRLKMDDGLPDYEGIVPSFEPSRLKPVSAIEFASDVDLMSLRPSLSLVRQSPSVWGLDADSIAQGWQIWPSAVGL